MQKFLLPLLLFLSFFDIGQAKKRDSILNVLKTEKDDSVKVENLIYISDSYLRSEKFDTALIYADQSLALAEKINCLYSIAHANEAVGHAYVLKDNTPKAQEFYFKAQKIYEEKGYKKALALLYRYIGTTYTDLSNYPKALEYCLKALSMDQAEGNKENMSTDDGSISNVYFYMNDFNKALEYAQDALKIREGLGDKYSIAFTLCNIGSIYTVKNDFTSSLDYYLKALSIGEEIKADDIVNYCIGNLGGIYYKLGNYNKALDYDQKALKMGEDAQDMNMVSMSEDNIGEAYIKLKQYKEAESHLRRSLAIDSSIGRIEGKKDVYLTLSQLYSQTGQWQKAFDNFRNYSITKDSLFNQDRSKEIGKLEARADYDKQLYQQKAEEDKKAALATEKSKKQRLIIFFTGIIAITIFIVAIFIFRSLRTTRKQKTLIEKQKIAVEEQKILVEEQKILVEEKNKDIIDSINYAKRLQDAILPPIHLIQQHLPETFLMYKPKDIVAGDFYWMEKSGDTILIAAADCTGHGVPGAMVSVVCSNALNRTIHEFGITSPGNVLDKVRELVLKTFEKSENGINDGMDISLASLTPSEGGITMKWAGANNPLWYVQGNEMKEITADKQPIGKYENHKPFTTHTLQLQKGDILYLFTDGYPDQFGGPKGKKFKYKQLQEKLMEISPLDTAKQKEQLEATLHNWKGNLEQVDDILVLGIKV